VTVYQGDSTGDSVMDGDREPPSGRHALDEDALLTPIYHALARGGWRRGGGRRPEPESDPAPAARPVPLEEIIAFQRDPLTAPIPIQALGPAPALPTRWERSPRRDAVAR
jgi:hypothetical protein